MFSGIVMCWLYNIYLINYIFHQVPVDWDNVRVELEGADNIEPNSPCAEYETNYSAGNIRRISLPHGKTNFLNNLNVYHNIRVCAVNYC